MSIQEINMSDFPENNPPTRILLGPGPSMVDPRVLHAMAVPLLGHLDPNFVQLMDRTQGLLRHVMQTDNLLTIPVSGTGSAAMEAAIANMVEYGDKVLVCVAGYFGLRLADMVVRYGGILQTIQRPWGEVFTANDIEEALQKSHAKIVAIVHAETSTGAKQPLEEIVKVVHNMNAILIVDTVTSLGGIPFYTDVWDLDVVYSGSQKCLSCPPGMSPISLGSRAIDVLNSRKSQVKSWYLDLTSIQKYWGKDRTYHHTAPISAVYSFYEALRIVAKEGLENRWKRHRDNAEMFWAGLEKIGLECHVPLENRLESLTTVKVPAGVEEATVRQKLLSEFNIEISGGLGELKGKVWRVGLMGYSSHEENIIKLLEALKKLIN
jgi:alanine-glyoxylate transaminase / serine-glyoxylate transaminase / serine-pyruvate transaminase